MTTLKEIGESGLLSEIYNSFSIKSASEIGVGDDAAVIHRGDDKSLLVTVDALVEGTHFLREKISAAELGHKTISVNLSDIAAMGGTPLYAFLSFGLPSDISLNWAKSFLLSFKHTASEYGVKILGGDTIKSEKSIMLSATVIGECEKSNIKLRKDAKEGDVVCASGFLGDSAAGFKLLMKGMEHELVKIHHSPVPQVEEGKWLGKNRSVHAMMDVSDGISTDLDRMAKASGVKIEIYEDLLPLSDALKGASSAYNFNPLECAISGGEDYVLVFTVKKEQYEELSKKFEDAFKRPIYKIGEVKKGNSEVVFLDRNFNKVTVKKGFDNFRNY